MGQGRSKSRPAAIPDNYTCIEEVTEGLREAGLESSELIVCIDFTKSNGWNGTKSFHGATLTTSGGCLIRVP